MKRAHFSEGQIISILKEAGAGAKVPDLWRRHGISDATFYTWRSKYGGLEVSEMRRLRPLEEENRRLRSIVTDQALDLRPLKDMLAKNGYGPEFRGRVVDEWAYGRSVRLQFIEPGKPSPECLHRIDQRPVARGVPQRAGLPLTRRRAAQGRTVE